jgi:hypothetical protein
MRPIVRYLSLLIKATIAPFLKVPDPFTMVFDVDATDELEHSAIVLVKRRRLISVGR